MRPAWNISSGPRRMPVSFHWQTVLPTPPVNAERPAALLRILDLDRHPPDAIDFDCADFAVLHRAEPLVIGATGEHVANLQRGNAGGSGDNCTN